MTSSNMGIHSRTLSLASTTLLATLLICLLTLMGNSHEPEVYGRSVLSWLVGQWLDPGSGSGHGWFIPLVSLFFLWRRRNELRAAERAPDSRALALVVPALLFYWAGYRAQQPRLGVICFITLSWAIPFYFWGLKVARLLIFPCSYLVFAIPMGFLISFAFPLRLFSCMVAASLLNGLGIETLRTGTIITSPAMKSFALNIDDPCSGLQSLVALTALTAAYAAFTQKTLLKQWLLFASSVPLAMLANVIRIMTIAIVAAAFGHELAMKIYHDFSGYIIFVTAVLMMMSLGALLQRGLQRHRPSSPAQI